MRWTLIVLRTHTRDVRREMLLGGATQQGIVPQETEATAERDTAGLLQLQRQMMGQQDQMLEEVEKSVKNTKVGRLFSCLAARLPSQGGQCQATTACHQVVRAAACMVLSAAHSAGHWRGGGPADAPAGRH